jgi:hypothetical protein
MEAWYQINKDVEYSTYFNFFLENQIIVSKSGKNYSFNSRLEKKCFMVKTEITSNGTMDNEIIKHYCRVIHNEILNGKHGTGILID